ncbi:MAG TPA: tyrosine-type recombinase/integrase, partial [Thermoanaerobaculales bacterium]|nr:tyrosine-type recombinase/integrase [Thermoanaerobaculales bacterium]
VDFDVGSGLVRCVRGKTRQDTWIPMTEELRTALEGHLVDPRFPAALVFPKLSPIRVERYFAIAIAIAGLDPRFRFKDLRHTFASTLVQAGVDLYTVQKLMAHSTPRMTQRYAHLAPKKFQDAITAMEQFNHPKPEASVGNSVGNPPGTASSTSRRRAVSL